MSVKSNRLIAYTEWKSMGLKRRVTQELADHFGVSRVTIRNWSLAPIDIDGQRFKNWEEAYIYETKQIRENFEKEVNQKLENGYKLLDCICDELNMRYLNIIQNPDYRPTVEEVIKINELVEKRRVNEEAKNKPQEDENITNVTNQILAQLGEALINENKPDSESEEASTK